MISNLAFLTTVQVNNARLLQVRAVEGYVLVQAVRGQSHVFACLRPPRPACRFEICDRMPDELPVPVQNLAVASLGASEELQHKSVPSEM